MATVNPVISQISQPFALLYKQMAAFFTFVFTKLRNFQKLRLEEQIAYGLIGTGLVLAVTAIVLFML